MSGVSHPNILILSAQVPFTSGGAEILIENLRRELVQRGCFVDVVSLPFAAVPKSSLLKQMALWRDLELESFAGRQVDLVIATKFPTYMVKHHNKVVWLIHQHRQLYELYGSRFGDFSTEPEDESLRRMVFRADRQALSECRVLSTISSNVSERLKRYLGLDSQPLPPPLPRTACYYAGEKGDYILSVGRLCSIKRVDLILKAMPMIKDSLKLKIVGAADEPAIDAYLKSETEKHHLWHRVEFLGRVGDQELLDLYAKSFAVYYAPYDEDYGFVALESLSSAKPVVTAEDSGTVREFIKDRENGLVVKPQEKEIAAAFNLLLTNPDLYEQVAGGAAEYREKTSWDQIVEALLRPLSRDT